MFGKKGFYESSSLLKSTLTYSLFITLIVLNIMDFFEALSPEMDFLKKILSWTFLGMLLYRASLSRIFFGEKNGAIDISLILSYFLFVIKDFIQYASVILSEVVQTLQFDAATNSLRAIYYIGDHQVSHYLMSIYAMLLKYPLIPTIGVLIGLASFIIISFIIARKVRVGYPSLLQILGEEGSPTGRDIPRRFVKVFLVIVGFYVVCFNLMMQWLAIAVDAPLLVVGLFFYIFLAKNLTFAQRLEKLGSMGEDFYHQFVTLFARRRTILWALSGLVVLHILTDIANLVLPYLVDLSIRDALFIHALEDRTIFDLFNAGIQNLDLYGQIILGAGYVLSALGMILLMYSAGHLWNKTLKERVINFHPLTIFVFVLTAIYFLLNPVFTIGMIGEEGKTTYGYDGETGEAVGASTLIGVKIGLREIDNEPVYFYIALGVATLFTVIYFTSLGKRVAILFTVLGSQIFFLNYMRYYFVSAFLEFKSLLWDIHTWGLSLDFWTNIYMIYPLFFLWAIIGLMTLLFYVVGSIGFLYKTWKSEETEIEE